VSDEIPTPASPVSAAPVSAPANPSRRGAWVVSILLLVAIGAALWAWNQWRTQADRSAQRDDATAALRQRVDALETALESAQRAVKALETRAADNSATNKVLREELLGMGERAALLEDAVARLADNRLRGEVVMRLNEAEFLLLLGEERLRLFGDAPAAIQAFSLADATLAGLDDAPLATLRQTLAQEMAALRSIAPDARATLRAGLNALAHDLEALPVSRRGEVAMADGNDSRLMQLLSRLVTVRRIDANDAVLGPAQREAALVTLRLRLELAQAALSRPDPAAYREALDAAASLMPRLFDAKHPEVANRLAALKTLRDAKLLPELPVLGATLQELRGLRATRSVGALPAAPGSEAAPPSEPGGLGLAPAAAPAAATAQASDAGAQPPGADAPGGE
jgi:uroporphyrin-3 C-methyltransferase